MNTGNIGMIKTCFNSMNIFIVETIININNYYELIIFIIIVLQLYRLGALCQIVLYQRCWRFVFYALRYS